MRSLQPGLAAHLAAADAGGVTTLCRCWTLTRRDGLVLGFTDHDGDLAFGGVTYQARSGLNASEAEREIGLGVASVDVAGVLSAASITEADIASGLYDDARVDVLLVDWSNPANRQRLDVMTIGEIRRGDAGFVAELRSPAHRFDEERGRLYTVRCGADLGDAACAKAITASPATVTASPSRSEVRLSGLIAFAAGWFTGGRITFLDGANAGVAVEVASHAVEAGGAVIRLWLEAPHPIMAGDAVSLTPGCDKSFATCGAKFANTANFQGFPHIPGSDFLLQVAGEGQTQRFDGGSLFR